MKDKNQNNNLSLSKKKKRDEFFLKHFEYPNKDKSISNLKINAII